MGGGGGGRRPVVNMNICKINKIERGKKINKQCQVTLRQGKREKEKIKKGKRLKTVGQRGRAK